MAKYVEFKIEDLRRLAKDEGIKEVREFFTEPVLEKISTLPFKFAIESEGEVVAMGGVAEIWPNRGEGWIFFDSKCKTNFLPVFRLVKSWVHALPFKRIEAAAKLGSSFAHRHLQLLGFELEAPVMKAFYPNGDNYSLYARVK